MFSIFERMIEIMVSRSDLRVTSFQNMILPKGILISLKNFLDYPILFIAP